MTGCFLRHSVDKNKLLQSNMHSINTNCILLQSIYIESIADVLPMFGKICGSLDV